MVLFEIQTTARMYLDRMGGPGTLQTNEVRFLAINMDLRIDTEKKVDEFRGKLFRVTVEEIPWPKKDDDGIV